MSLNVYDINGKKTSEEIALNPEIFAITPSEHILYLAVKTYLANQRQRTSKAKGRSEVSGSTAKMFKQKGTGGARRGSKRSPLLVGGGKTFGPQLSETKYTLKMNKKQKVLARKSAYSLKASSDSIYIMDNFKVDVPKTKPMVSMLKEIGILEKKVLVLFNSYSYLDDDDKYDNIVNNIRSFWNIKNVKCQVADNVTPYEIVNADYLLIQKDALEIINRINS